MMKVVLMTVQVRGTTVMETEMMVMVEVKTILLLASSMFAIV